MNISLKKKKLKVLKVNETNRHTLIDEKYTRAIGGGTSHGTLSVGDPTRIPDTPGISVSIRDLFN